MRNPIGSIALLFSLCLTSGLFWFSPAANLKPAKDKVSDEYHNYTPPCVACQPTDSLALVALFNSTNGFLWTTLWYTFSPVCNWYGVTLDAEGYVTSIRLSNNNLFGPIPPQIGNFSRLEELKIDNNQVSGTIPTQMGNLTKLSSLFIDNNNLTGTIPSSLGNLINLETFFLDNNQLTGRIPIEFNNLVNLQAFEFFVNRIDSLPDLSALPSLLNNRYKAQSNRLTFDDILPNIGLPLGVFYHPQDSVGTAATVTLTTGSNYAINLNIDPAITTSNSASVPLVHQSFSPFRT